MKGLRLLLTAFTLLLFTRSEAQLYFPGGTELHHVSHNKVMYEETEILFHTGNNHIEDYTWQKTGFESVDSNWLIQACMNGDCKLNLPSSGNFINDFGYNDTTGFIKFHVFTNGYEGTAIITYKVSHKTNPDDFAILHYNISYQKPTSVDELNAAGRISIYPNPASNWLSITCNGTCPEVFTIYDYTGKLLQTIHREPSPAATIDLTNLANGLYILRSSLSRPYIFQVNK